MPRAVAGYERVAEVPAEPLPAAPAGGRELPDGPLELVVDRLGYGYEPGAEVLHEVSFRVPAGTPWPWSAPPGPASRPWPCCWPACSPPTGAASGSAAATWPSWTEGELAAAVSIAFQEPFLFSTSVADNIRLDRPHQDGVLRRPGWPRRTSS